LKILFLTFYYQPDLCAGSFRATPLVNELIKQLPNNSHIDLITTLPNRYNSFSSEAPCKEFYNKLTINRISVLAHNNSIIKQSISFIIFTVGVLRLCKKQDYDLVFASSSRLMTATLGAYISRKSKKPLYLDIRDIFVDTIKDVFPNVFVFILKPLLSKIERFTINSSNKVNLVSKGFLPYFKNNYNIDNYSFFTNGIDEEFIYKQSQDFQKNNSKPLKVVYAGNIGDGQGLHKIIPKLAIKFEGYLNFKLIGDGGRKKTLIKAIKKAGCNNVCIIPPVNRNELIKHYQKADILLIHLNEYQAFKKVLPSKLFEYGAMGKPIWAGVSGYAAEFIKKNIKNSVTFKPCNVDDAIASFEALEIITKERKSFVKKFSRKNIMQDMSLDIISLARKD
jgi:hypothetical protein